MDGSERERESLLFWTQNMQCFGQKISCVLVFPSIFGFELIAKTKSSKGDLKVLRAVAWRALFCRQRSGARDNNDGNEWALSRSTGNKCAPCA